MSEEKITVQIIKKIAAGLNDDLANIVFIGCIASFLYHYKLKMAPLLYTYDLDAVVKKTRSGNLRTNIEKIGFVELPARGRGKSSGKFSTDKWAVKGRKVKIELLLPLKGKYEPWGKIEPGLEAERLRYLDMLTENCREIDLGDGIVLNIPHPARFIIQKLLVYDKRKSPEEKEKDAAYVAGIIGLFFDRLDVISDEINAMGKRYLRNNETQRWVPRAIEKYIYLFGHITSDGTVAASQQLKTDSRIIYRQAGIFIRRIS